MTAASEHLTIFNTSIFPTPLLSSTAVTAVVYSKWQRRDQRLEPQEDASIVLPSATKCNTDLAARTVQGQALLQYMGRLRGVQGQATVPPVPHRDCNVWGARRHVTAPGGFEDI